MAILRVGRRGFVVAFLWTSCSLNLFTTTWGAEGTASKTFRSCPPMRPLPTVSATPLSKGPGLFVDAAKGNDAAAGTKDAPWKSVRRALKQLQPGDTLYLRGGTYYERLSVNVVGDQTKPVTIRSYPGELAILDGGYREFIDHPQTAWEPVAGGPAGEFRSTKSYPELAEDTGVAPWHEKNPEHPRVRIGPAPQPNDELGVVRGIYGSGYFSAAVKVLGNFADSMVPLHGYYHLPDLPADDPYIGKRKPEYAGPGVWYNMRTQRIHITLAHTEQERLGDLNYRGETDPRQIGLVIGGPRVVLHLEGAKHLRLQDLVIRGSRSRTLNIENCAEIDLDHVTLYGGAPALHIQSTQGLRLQHSAVRGVCAPWSSRSSEKYFGISSYLLVGDSTSPQSNRIEISSCEFTDNHDGLIIGTINGLRFHHNYVDNFNDDGLYMTTDMPAGADVRIYQNYLSRSLSMFAVSGAGRDQQGKEASICRNIIDLRGAMNNNVEYTYGRTCGDHGSPIWKPMLFYHNTIVVPDPVYRNYYGAGLARALKDTKRHYLNNIFYFVKGTPGFYLELAGDQLADGNLHYSAELGAVNAEEFLTKARQPARKQPNWFEESKKNYAPGWTAHDIYADPLFVKLTAKWGEPLDLRLQSQSPAINRGVEVPNIWFDPLRENDPGKPDIGALPANAAAWRIGIHSRLTAFGQPANE